VAVAKSGPVELRVDLGRTSISDVECLEESFEDLGVEVVAVTAEAVAELVRRLSNKTRTSSNGISCGGRPQPSEAQSSVNGREPAVIAKNRRSITSRCEGENEVMGGRTFHGTKGHLTP
jgi:hypothetical protein